MTAPGGCSRCDPDARRDWRETRSARQSAGARTVLPIPSATLHVGLTSSLQLVRTLHRTTTFHAVLSERILPTSPRSSARLVLLKLGRQATHDHRAGRV